jgi:hypothetical protein
MCLSNIFLDVFFFERLIERRGCQDINSFRLCPVIHIWSPKTLFYIVHCTVCRVEFEYAYEMNKLLKIALCISTSTSPR